jgi:hypothetical protein
MNKPASRRTALGRLASAASAASRSAHSQAQPTLATRVIPASRERMPAVGLGNWITFNVGADRAPTARCPSEASP